MALVTVMCYFRLLGSWFCRLCRKHSAGICPASREASGSFYLWWEAKRELVYLMAKAGASEGERERENENVCGGKGGMPPTLK